ncbi:MAG TPA: ABC transporter permease [Deltaproteobacteria bacterium]|nr:ABC transporter permease [Deltaproteobacteria bacterium]
MRSVYFKELSIYFSSPIFYVIAGIFACISGIFFYNAMGYVSLLSTRIAQYQPTGALVMNDILLRPIFADISMLIVFIVPVISMRLYAEEKAQGTIELLFTYPVSDLKVLAGKYLAGLSILICMLAITVVLMVLMSLITTPDWGVVLSSYIGLVLMGAAILSLGVFASSLTKNQIIAATLTLGLVLCFWVIGWFAATSPDSSLSGFLQEISIVSHQARFLKGLITLRDVVFYLCFSLFFLSITLRVLDSRRWRG